MALEAEAILQGKTLKRLASEMILKGASKKALNFVQESTVSIEANVNYPALKDGACDYAKSRVASGGLTKPPWDSKIYLKSRVLCSMFIAPARSAWVS